MADAFDYYERTNQMIEQKRINDQIVKKQFLANKLAESTLNENIRNAGLVNENLSAEVQARENNNRLFGDTYSDLVQQQGISNRFNTAQAQGMENNNDLYSATRAYQIEDAMNNPITTRLEQGNQRLMQQERQEKMAEIRRQAAANLARQVVQSAPDNQEAWPELMARNAKRLELDPSLFQGATSQDIGALAQYQGATGDIQRSQLEQRKREYELEVRKFEEMSPSQREQNDIRKQLLDLEKQRIQIAENNQNPELQADIAGSKSYGGSIGKNQAEYVSQAPSVIRSADQVINVANDLLKHPGIDAATGTSYAVTKKLRDAGIVNEGTDFLTRLEQLQGGVFMQAYETLKGGGPITDIEGKKGTESIARISPGQSKSSLESGIKDLISYANSRKNKAIDTIDSLPKEVGQGVLPSMQDRVNNERPSNNQPQPQQQQSGEEKQTQGNSQRQFIKDENGNKMYWEPGMPNWSPL